MANSASNSFANSAANSSTAQSGGGSSQATFSIPCQINCNGSASSSGTQGTGGGGGGDSSAGSNTSAANSSSGSGECDPEAADYLECIGNNKKDFAAHTVTDSGATTFGEVNQNFMDRLNGSPVVQSFSSFENIMTVEQSECPVFSIDLTDTLIGREISTDLHCQLMESIRPVLSIVMMIIWSFVAFRVFASA